MITGIAHIGIAVTDIDAATRVFTSALGGQLIERKQKPDMNLEIALISLGGVTLELLQATGDGPIATFVQKRGPGFHHLAFDVKNIEEALRVCTEQGVQLIDEIPRAGAAASKIAFLHPRATSNVLIEFCEH
jgi:methylmalonyl-CoA/ethylmalonyl-CoA epimerase